LSRYSWPKSYRHVLQPEAGQVVYPFAIGYPVSDPCLGA
jgi:hypothetical protein